MLLIIRDDPYFERSIKQLQKIFGAIVDKILMKRDYIDNFEQENEKDSATVLESIESLRQSPSQILRTSEHLSENSLVDAVLGALPEIAVIVNDQRQVVYGNALFAEALGVPDTRQVLGLRPGEIFNCVHASTTPGGCGASMECKNCGCAKTVLASQRTQETVTGECHLTIGDPNEKQSLRELELQVRATPLKLTTAEPLTLVCLRDIADEKRHKILERVFFHDMLNNVVGVKSLLEILQEVSDERERDDILETVALGVEGLYSEISAQQTLQLAEKVLLQVNSETVESKIFIEKTVGVFSKWTTQEDLTFFTNQESTNTSISCDPKILERILINMLKNAAEASSAGAVIEAGCLASDCGVEFYVKNPAVISESVKPFIFNRSFSTKGPGRGLGTYSIKLLTERYLNGSVGFRSSEKEGTRFFVVLPKLE